MLVTVGLAAATWPQPICYIQFSQNKQTTRTSAFCKLSTWLSPNAFFGIKCCNFRVSHMIHTVSPMAKVETCFNLPFLAEYHPSIWDSSIWKKLPGACSSINLKLWTRPLGSCCQFGRGHQSIDTQSSDVVSFMVTQLRGDCGQASFPQGPPVFTILVRSFVVRDVTDMAKIRLQVAKAVGSPGRLPKRMITRWL